MQKKNALGARLWWIPINSAFLQFRTVHQKNRNNSGPQGQSRPPHQPILVAHLGTRPFRPPPPHLGSALRRGSGKQVMALQHPGRRRLIQPPPRSERPQQPAAIRGGPTSMRLMWLVLISRTRMNNACVFVKTHEKKCFRGKNMRKKILPTLENYFFPVQIAHRGKPQLRDNETR